jgi:hypothetical protein
MGESSLERIDEMRGCITHNRGGVRALPLHRPQTMNRGGFSWKRALGISAAKARLSRKIGVPLTRTGRQRKIGAALGCALPVVAILICVLAVIAYAAGMGR